MSTKANGDLEIKKQGLQMIQLFLTSNDIGHGQFVAMEQTHGVGVKIIEDTDIGETVKNIDGLISQNSNVFFGVNTADCVPLFFYDPLKKIVAVAHSGWKGSLGKIAVKVIQKMQSSGSDPKNILVAIGPHIGGCCYNVPEERVQLFLQAFGKSVILVSEKRAHPGSVPGSDSGQARMTTISNTDSTMQQIAFIEGNKWHLDLGFINKLQLLDSGILPEHIDSPITCTSCQNDTYFSFRKEGPKTYGEMLGIIGIKN